MTLRVFVAIVFCAAAQEVTAQDAPAFRPRRPLLAAGISVAGGYPTGDVTATLRRNAPGNAPPVTLFQADSSFERATGADVRVVFPLTRAFAIEVGGAYAVPRLSVRITGDTEATDPGSPAEEISQYAVDVSGMYHLSQLGVRGRMRPYVIGGGGYLRQLHEGRVVVETGQTLHAGVGVHYWLRGGGRATRPVGVRAEFRYVRRTGGIDFEDRSRGFPLLSVLGFVGF